MQFSFFFLLLKQTRSSINISRCRFFLARCREHFQDLVFLSSPLVTEKMHNPPVHLNIPAPIMLLLLQSAISCCLFASPFHSRNSENQCNSKEKHFVVKENGTASVQKETRRERAAKERVHSCHKKFSPSKQNTCCSLLCPHASRVKEWLYFPRKRKDKIHKHIFPPVRTC